MRIIDVFLSRPNWVPDHIENHFGNFYPLLRDYGFNPKTIGVNAVPIASPFEDVVNLMNKCECTIVLGLPQIKVNDGLVKGQEIERPFSMPTEWNQIEAAISIMQGKPTLMMLHRGVAPRGLFDRGAANVFVHEFHTTGKKWVLEMEPKLQALRERVDA